MGLIKITIVGFILAVPCLAQDAITFKTTIERDAWNQKGLPLGTNTTRQLYEVSATNALVVLVPTNEITRLKLEGRVKSTAGTNEPVIVKDAK